MTDTKLHFNTYQEFSKYVSDYITGSVLMRKQASEINILTHDGRVLATWNGIHGFVRERRRKERLDGMLS